MTASWLTYKCRVREADVATVENCLEELGAFSIACTAGNDDTLVVDRLDGAQKLWPMCEVSALFDDSSLLGDIERQLSTAGIAPLSSAIEEVVDKDWQNAWREQFKPLYFGDSFCVCPTWCEPPRSVPTVMRIDPGMAFGTGSHATTAMCLDYLACAAHIDNARVLDYGCGSGILAIGAMMLGASDVVAVDIDEDALRVCSENAARNGTKLTIGQPSIAAARRFDLIVANILLEPLLELRDSFIALLAPGGRLVVSGILAQQTSALRAHYAEHFDFVDSTEREQWALLASERRK